MKVMDKIGISTRSLVMGTLFALVFAVVTVYFENRMAIFVTASQIAVLPYVLMILTVLMINPLCRLLRVVRLFTITEIMIVFIMGSVSSGISTFGLASQLVPVSGSLFNRSWNNEQSNWNRYVTPTLNENFFVSVPGIQKAASELQADQEKLQAVREVYDVALRVRRTEAALHRAEADVAKAETAPLPEREMAGIRARQLCETARMANREALAVWETARHSNPSVSPETVEAQWPARIAELEKSAGAKRETLRGLETQAFAKVDLFRRGLSTEQRAYPGFFLLTADNWMTYSGRFRRLVHGLAARRHLGRAIRILDLSSGAGVPSVAVMRIREPLSLAIAELEKAQNTSLLENQAKAVEAEILLLNRNRLERQGELQRLGHQRRQAAAIDFSELDEKISEANKQENKLKGRIDQLKQDQDRNTREILINRRVMATREALRELSTGSEPTRLGVGETRAKLIAIVGQFPAFDASLRRFVLSDIPWSHWVRPLMNWSLLLGLTYLILMCFNLLIYRQWAHNEKLIYPLVELAETIVGVETDGNRRIPAIFRSGVFWAGFALSGFVLGWNILCTSNVVPGLQAFDLVNRWLPYISNSPLQGLLPSAKSQIFFTMIGLSFLIPARISFSLWLFSVLYMGQLLIMVWSGYGVDERSFPMEFLYTLNFQTAEGGGALMVFSSVVLWKCRKYILCFFMPDSVRDLDAGERKELRIASFLFIFGSIGLIVGLWKGFGANLFFTLFTYLVMLMLTIGMVRAVAEGGMLGFQAWVSPFHFVRTLFGMDKAWTAPPLFAPLLVFYSMLFLDIKTFIAPAMANSLKLREDLNLKRGRFHLALFIAILVAGGAAVVAHLMLAYDKGGDQMQNWFYNGLPKAIFDKISSMTQVRPVDMTANRIWLGFGASLMAALLFFRQFVFWLPHPLGLIMLVNPVMKAYWFSIFIGWLCKSAVTKYGNKGTYQQAKAFFIGLIVGELILVAIALLVSVVSGIRIPIDLNRN